MTATEWIQHLGLKPHPEGGHFREVYRSGERVARASLPSRFDGDRAFSTSIYFLLADGDFSAFHRIRQDEIWHHYDGGPVNVHVINEAGGCSLVKLGKTVAEGQEPQLVVRAGHWFGAELGSPVRLLCSAARSHLDSSLMISKCRQEASCCKGIRSTGKSFRG